MFPDDRNSEEHGLATNDGEEEEEEDRVDRAEAEADWLAHRSQVYSEQ